MARIVLIDDETRLLQTLARFLENQGHAVVRGERFADVQQELQPGRFEVLITDIVMPDTNGMQVLREVVEQRHCLEPVILITGEPNVETASEAVRRGAFDYISKPVTKDKLLEAVSRGLRHVRLLRERDAARRTEMQVLRNLAALGESASVLSHEIRTPITSLRHALRAVADKIGVDDRVLIEELVGNLNRIERMLGQTLSFARPLQLQRRALDAAELLRGCARQVHDLPFMHGVAVEVVVAQPFTVDVDEQLFGEVVVNLLRNAGEACNGKGQVRVRGQSHGPDCVVEVDDDGPGVPAGKRDEIFRPFHSSKEYGTGIGLAFCRKVVESHGGTIALIDRPGPGACFRIVLPASAGESEQPGASSDRHA
ncbi:MAG: HAMP domain-containing histidine kinase [Planctomycetes bacterium]|nr:HAMP domain-containing histidine kinase [Planctomycetota bacterium]